MKQILYVRHAKSDWSDARLDDFDRPLNDRGLMDAPGMAAFLQKSNLVPDLLLSSPAKRALSTAQLFAEVFGISEGDIATDETLYEAPVRRLLGVIHELPAHLDRVAIFSHNPSLSYAVSEFSDEYIGNVPTCGVALIQLKEGAWEDFHPGHAQLVDIWVPRDTLSRYAE